jgi:hypothetical protein
MKGRGHVGERRRWEGGREGNAKMDLGSSGPG